MASKAKEITALAKGLFLRDPGQTTEECIARAEGFIREVEDWRAEHLKEPKLPPLAAEALREFVGWLSLLAMSRREGKNYVLLCDQDYVDAHLAKWRAAARELGVEVCGDE